MGSTSYPPPPDPKETAKAQADLNVQTAIAQQKMNMINQITPQGTLTYRRSDTLNQAPTGQQPAAPGGGSAATGGAGSGVNLYDTQGRLIFDTSGNYYGNDSMFQTSNPDSGTTWNPIALQDAEKNKYLYTGDPGSRNYQQLQPSPGAPTLAPISQWGTNGFTANGTNTGGIGGVGSLGSAGSVGNANPKLGDSLYYNDIPQYEAITQLSPEEQRIFDLNQANRQLLGQTSNEQLGKIRGILNTPFTLPGGLPELNYGQSGGLPGLQYADYGSLPGLNNTQFSGLPGLQYADYGNLPNLQYTQPGNLPGLDYTQYGNLPQLSPAEQEKLLSQIDTRTNDTSRQLLDPIWSQREEALRTRLANQGITQGAQAYSNALRDFGDERSRSYISASLPYRQQALNEVIGSSQNAFGQQLSNRQLLGQEQQQEFANSLAGRQQLSQEQQNMFANSAVGRQLLGQEQQNMFANSLAGRQQMTQEQQQEFANSVAGRQLLGQEQQNIFANSLAGRQQMSAEQQAEFARTLSGRQQGIQEGLIQRNQPLNEISALLGGSQVQMPQWINTPSVAMQSPDYQGLVQSNYQAQVQQANAKAQSQNAMLGGLFGLLSAPFGMMSDRRAKKDIKQVGTLDNGLPVYRFRYRSGGPYQIGLMADEVEGLHPEAVMSRDEIKYVNYEAATEPVNA